MVVKGRARRKGEGMKVNGLRTETSSLSGGDGRVGLVWPGGSRLKGVAAATAAEERARLLVSLPGDAMNNDWRRRRRLASHPLLFFHIFS